GTRCATDWYRVRFSSLQESSLSFELRTRVARSCAARKRHDKAAGISGEPGCVRSGGIPGLDPGFAPGVSELADTGRSRVLARRADAAHRARADEPGGGALASADAGGERTRGAVGGGGLHAPRGRAP